MRYHRIYLHPGICAELKKLPVETSIKATIPLVPKSVLSLAIVLQVGRYRGKFNIIHSLITSTLTDIAPCKLDIEFASNMWTVCHQLRQQHITIW